MARGNLFQGMAHGALGDVTFQRKNGMQVSSVRVRQQTNPESTKQCYQRTCFASVVQAYAAGREIFDHSFEGCSTPADNQAKFYSLNVARLQQALLNGAAQHTYYSQDDFRFVAPHVSWPVPSTFRISEGSIPSADDVFGFTRDNNFTIGFKLWGQYEVNTLGDFLSIWPFEEDTLFTVCQLSVDTNQSPVFTVPANVAANDSIHCNNQYKCYFTFFRFKRLPLREINLRTPIRTAYWKDFFYIECAADLESIRGRIYNHLLRDDIFFYDMNKQESLSGCWGIIRSNVNDGRRSTTDMRMCYSPFRYYPKNFGLSGGYIADAWRIDSASIAP